MNVMMKVSPIAVYDEFRAQLAELREHNAKLVFDYEDPKGNEEARSHVYKLRRTKSAVDKARQSEKSASLEYGRRVDSEAKEIIGEIEAMIDVHARPLAEIEEREKQRIEGHTSRIEAMRQAMEEPLNAACIGQRARDVLATVKAVDLETFEEFQAEAALVKDQAVKVLEEHLAKVEKREVEAAELERLRAEAAERQRRERDEAIRKEAAERAAAEAEQKAQAERAQAEAKGRAEREAAERRELELKLAAEKAEREKVEAEQRATRAAEETERRLKKEAEERAAAEAAETAKREADKKHRATINRSAAAAFVAGGMSEDMAKLAVTLIAQKSIPHVAISY